MTTEASEVCCEPYANTAKLVGLVFSVCGTLFLVHMWLVEGGG